MVIVYRSNTNNWSQAIADVIRTCLGPRAMLKMLMDPMGGIVMTNDGNAILREVSECFQFQCMFKNYFMMQVSDVA